MNRFNSENTTVIICCAGMGTRLGIGTTKALLNIAGKPLIIRQLELLNDFDDVRIVAGFQAEKLIRTVNEYRKDILFAFNYQYESTGAADSLRKGILAAREYVIYLDGDILVNPDDFSEFLMNKDECVGVSKISSPEIVKAKVERGKVTELSKQNGNMQWSGFARLLSTSLNDPVPHVYNLINKSLPLPAVAVRSREINTQEDYEKAVDWFESGCKEE